MIYVHVPFCHRKCTYCAFYSKPVLETRGVSPAGERYVDSLLAEMEQRKGEQAHPIKTVYFGGGTPSILPLEQFARIVEGLRRCFDLSMVEEMTLEANPEDLTPAYLSDLLRLGFNRLSIGVQSLDDAVLRLLNRRHTARQALDLKLIDGLGYLADAEAVVEELLDTDNGVTFYEYEHKLSLRDLFATPSFWGAALQRILPAALEAAPVRPLAK